ncbi:MAG: TonB-dependent receptor, partial [Caulobacterales bacterium]|nr:TonB-dependent receptor [Caulobacterales bacterium]
RPDPFGGSPIFRYVDNENLGSVVASPGAGDVTLPSATSLGPVVSYNTTPPSQEPSAMMSVTFGDDDLNRTFVKLETGDIFGFSGYVSRSKIDQNLWRGAGTIDREHIEAKGRYEFDPDTFLEATFVYNDFFDYDSPSGTRSFFEEGADLAGRSGRDRGYIDYIPDGCNIGLDEPVDFNNDGVIDDADFQPVSVGGDCTQYFIDRVNAREDALSSLKFATDITDGVTLDALIYYEDKDGFGVSPDGYSNTLGRYLDQVEVGLPVTHPRGIQYGLSTVGGDRKGATAGVTWEAANHVVEVGGWYEEEGYHRLQARYNKTAGSPAGTPIFDEITYFRRDYTSTREFTQYYLKDTISLMGGDLTVEAGFKGLHLDYELDGYRDFADYAIRVDEAGGGDTLPGYGPQLITADWSDGFLPMVGAVYDVTETEQVFASYSENLAIPREADTIFDDAVSFVAPEPEAEQSQNYEIGVRTSREGLALTLAGYYTLFDNRIVTGSVFNPATEQPETFSINAGETTAIGFELSGFYQPPILNDQVYANFNLTYNKTELQDGFGVNEAGNALADSPEWLFTGGITYEPTEWFVGNISTKYTGERFADFSEGAFQPGNVMESYFLWSLYADLGGPNPFGAPDNVSVRLNVDNLFDEDTLAFTFTTAGTGNAFFRPLSPRTVSLTLTAAF